MKKKLTALATAFLVSLSVQVSASPVAKACLDIIGLYKRTLSSLDYDYAYGLNSFSTGSGYCGLQPVGTVVEAPQTKEYVEYLTTAINYGAAGDYNTAIINFERALRSASSKDAIHEAARGLLGSSVAKDLADEGDDLTAYKIFQQITGYPVPPEIEEYL